MPRTDHTYDLEEFLFTFEKFPPGGESVFDYSWSGLDYVGSELVKCRNLE